MLPGNQAGNYNVLNIRRRRSPLPHYHNSGCAIVWRGPGVQPSLHIVFRFFKETLCKSMKNALNGYSQAFFGTIYQIIF